MQEARQIAERERKEKEETQEANSELLKKIMVLSLNKLMLLKKVGTTKETEKENT